MLRKRIYISSTYDDLLEYRRIAARVIEDCGHIAKDSYKGGFRPTVEQCIDDVATSDIYLGIIGLRYGFVPRDNDPRSITEREFDAAAGKPRLMFLLSDKHADLRDPIKSFRERLPAVTHPVQFVDQDSLTTAIRETIRERIGAGAPVPDLLPYLCNRGEQSDRIDDVLWMRRQQNLMHPVIFVVHGDDYQSGDRFIEVLVRHRMPAFKAIHDTGEQVKEFSLDWPHPFGSVADFQSRLTKELSEKVLLQRHGTPEDIQSALLEVHAPVVIHTLLSTSDWTSESESAVLEFFRFWDRWKGLNRVRPLVICLRFRYEEGSSGVLGYFHRRQALRANQSIYTFLKKCWPTWLIETHALENCRFEVLQELHRVPRRDVDSWSKLEPVKEHTKEALEPKIRDLYEKRFRENPKMEPLAGALIGILNGE